METRHLTIDRLLAEVQRHGKVETSGGQLVLTGRFPKALLEELHERRDEVARTLALPRQSPLMEALDDTPGIPRLTLKAMRDRGHAWRRGALAAAGRTLRGGPWR